MSNHLIREFNDFLSQKLSENNRKQCVRVVKKLVSGEGVTHKAKPGEAFCKGRCITLEDDLEKLRLEGKAWLPYQKNDPNCLDHGHGWALNHCIARLRDYQVSKRNAETTAPTSSAAVQELGSSDEEEDPKEDSHAMVLAEEAAAVDSTKDAETTASMDVDEDDIDMDAAGGGRIVIHTERGYTYTWPKAYQQFARTVHMNRRLCTHLKKKGMLNKAHPQMKTTISKFFNDNPEELDGTGLVLGGYAVDHVMAKNGEGLDHVANFHLMPCGVNCHFGDKWTSEKRRYVGELAAKAALGLHSFFKRTQYEFDFSGFKPLHYM
ncbi:hypothetical protein N9S81_00395 [bacterium]|nr:hypothetical protein [bacterium]